MIGPRPTAAAPGTGRSSGATRGPPQLDAYNRYAEVLLAQLEALSREDPDLDRFGALAAERAALADRIDADGLPPTDSPEVRQRLEECQRTDAAVLRRLSELRLHTAQALDALDERKAGRSGYQSAAPGNGGRTVDVKF
jgi:hypothetical protein